ncbi:hypothetical protein I79_007390 [Cricetulus griseus]|uniref:Uncharacterized protein n=1 Tax=Cricetulus griseus TaxID=10029 RepID=G3HAE1_CRIGR|nr:hypothetical protein I79_007390 [Cricetulus griseus]
MGAGHVRDSGPGENGMDRHLASTELQRPKLRTAFQLQQRNHPPSGWWDEGEGCLR